mgnify:CR=1 FL=1
MPYAIEMFFDKNSDAYIRQIWRTLKERIERICKPTAVLSTKRAVLRQSEAFT